MRSVLEERARAVQIHDSEGFTETSAVARYRRQVNVNEIWEGTREINHQTIADIFLEDATREEEELMKR